MTSSETLISINLSTLLRIKVWEKEGRRVMDRYQLISTKGQQMSLAGEEFEKRDWIELTRSAFWHELARQCHEVIKT